MTDMLLKEIGKSDKREVISSRRRVTVLMEIWSMGSLLGTELRGREGELFDRPEERILGKPPTLRAPGSRPCCRSFAVTFT
jgi:hypothetical protein